MCGLYDRAADDFRNLRNNGIAECGKATFDQSSGKPIIDST